MISCWFFVSTFHVVFVTGFSLVRSDDIMVIVLDGIFVSSGCGEHFK